MSLEYARLAWSRYVANSSDVETILTHEEQDSLAIPASPTASAERDGVAGLEVCLHSNLVMLAYKKTV